MAAARIALRPVVDADREFLLALYATTRADELALLPWSPEQKAAFVAHQFAAQDADYRRRHPDASFDVVLVDGRAAGRLYVARRPGELLLIDIALLPEARGRGVGTRLLRGLLDEAAERGDAVRAHVLGGNRALALYRRLGFAPAGTAPPYVRIEWRPPGAAQAKTAS